jgi:histidinol-phosphatase (PHP family)
MVRQALDLGFRHLGFSGHMDEEIHMDWDAYVADIARLRARYGDRLDILCGVELDALYDPACCPGAEYVIGSTHYLDVDVPFSRAVDWSPEASQRLCDECFGGDWYALCRAYFELEATVFDRTRCTFVGHFDLVTRFNDEMRSFDEDDPRYLAPALEAMEHLVGQGVPFEVNCGAHNRGRKEELYPRRSLLAALHDMGGEIFINSDAHQAAVLNGSFDVAVERAIACGFTHVNVLVHSPMGEVEARQLALDAL